MLSPADAALVRRDGGLPGLALVLDGDALAERLAVSWPEAGLRSARAVYLRYKPGTSCLVSYRATGPEGERDVHAIARAAGAASKLDKARDRARRPGAGRGTLVLEDCAVVVSAFPEDASLPALSRLTDPDRRRRLLRRALGRRARPGELTRLRYKPERRFVGRLASGGGPDLLLKVHSPAGFEGGLRGALGWRVRAPLAVPPLVGVLPEHNLLAFEWVAGRPLSEAIVSGEASLPELERVGEALARLHGSPPAAILPRGALAEAHHVRAVAAVLAFVAPAQAARVQHLGREIAGRLAARPSPGRPVHGDFHAGQVVLAGATAAVLDFDKAALADPAADLGSFLAYLEREVCTGRLAAERAAALGEGFLAGYGRAGTRPAEGPLALHLAAALLRMAPHFFRDRDPAWPERTEATLDRAAACLARHAAARVSVSVPAAEAPAAPAGDRGIPFLAVALDPRLVGEGLRRLPDLQAVLPGAAVRSLRVLRLKPGRRCLVEYGLVDPGGVREPLVVLGKVRARGADLLTCRLVRRLAERGFGVDSEDGVSVPPPFGALPEMGMWLMARVGGSPARDLLEGPAGPALAARLADALHKLHRAPVPAGRTHTVADELAILTDRLERAARERPEWAGRIARLAGACMAAAAGLAPREMALVHRDFYADQVMVDGGRVYLLDLDLCAAGDPALDAGNFAGHLVEQALRGHGDPRALDEARTALVDRFLARSGRATSAAVDVYTTLTLARHVWLSTQFPERRGTTAVLLDLCEERLDIGAATRKVTHAV